MPTIIPGKINFHEQLSLPSIAFRLAIVLTLETYKWFEIVQIIMNIAICKRRNGDYTVTNLQLGKDGEREEFARKSEFKGKGATFGKTLVNRLLKKGESNRDESGETVRTASHKNL